MKISDGEKLIILMLTELYQKLNVEGEIDPEFIRSAIFSNNLWSLPWKYSGIPFTDQETPDIVKEVLDILDMWSLIEYSYENLSDEEKVRLEEGAGVFGKDPIFRGFDGNNESTHMGTALFIVNDLDRFQEFAGRNMNSHMSSLDGYRRMLHKFENIRKNHEQFDVGNLIQLLNEQIHPENRK
ncbi:MAG: YfbU family protein [Pseudohongiella sp.]|nr:YfbU family protein [Pseudohongiella sp.]MDP2285471.1 YfbU family protein [Pseudohongiella sp.]